MGIIICLALIPALTLCLIGFGYWYVNNCL